MIGEKVMDEAALMEIQCTIGQGTCPLCWMQAIQQLQTDMSEAQSNVMHMSPPGRRLPLA